MKTSNLRCYVTLFDKNNKKIKSLVIRQSLNKVADKLGIEANLDSGDKIVIEEEGN